MARLPFNRFVRCGFYAPIYKADVRLEGTQIVGKWGDSFEDFYGEKGILLAQRFANWPSDSSKILKFTERYGPLTGSPSNGSGGFRFSLEDWEKKRRAIRASWKYLIGQDFHQSFHDQGFAFEFNFKSGEFVIQCPDLMTFMRLELSSCAKRLRLCEREGCTRPYFVPLHGKERYCSTECSNWAQSQWKKRWHEQQRKERVKKEKKGNGTQKAR